MLDYVTSYLICIHLLDGRIVRYVNLSVPGIIASNWFLKIAVNFFNSYLVCQPFEESVESDNSQYAKIFLEKPMQLTEWGLM